MRRLRASMKEVRTENSGRRTRFVATAMVGLAAIIGTVSFPVAPRAGAVIADSAATVVEWNTNAQAAIVGTAGQGPTVAYIHFAMVQGAVYDAVNAIEGGYQPYLEAPAVADTGDSAPAAVATAAHGVLIGLFPAQQANLDAKLAASLALIPDGEAKTGGIEVGEAASATMLAARTDDGRFSPFTVVEGFDPGEWRRTPPANVFEPAPWVANVRPFIIPSAAALRSDGPNALNSAAYAEDFNEVKRLGSLTSTVRTADQTDAALFWQGHQAGLFNSIFRQLAGTQTLDIAQAARL
ncbi:MAG TPA: PA-phosphatase, partial [Acidimicrobiia bacterium]|nr:PA-phosphatase [Acidimicrobiia bacterium]